MQAVSPMAMREAPQSILPGEIRILVCFASLAASSGELISQSFLGGGRRLQDQPRDARQCRAVAMRMMQPPALAAYEECFADKVRSNDSLGASDHDWSIPGAEVKAQVDCWCQTNLTSTMRDYNCCDHSDVYPMCSIDCQADCQSALAQECVQRCPAMCFEASEYVVDRDTCRHCDWVKCWPVLDCMLQHAEDRVESGDLARTCHETDFAAAPQLLEYWQCWKDIPKHSSHWNILSAIIHCICREGMQQVAKDTHCCDSVPYGGGACDLECVSETECATQEAQTCIHGCQAKCPALDLAPNDRCVEDCLRIGSPCRRYISCRPPVISNYICLDGRWPHASSGCCTNNQTGIVGCPRLCESQRMWRLDRTRGIPWWARYHPQEEMIAQCTCHECPESLEGIQEVVATTIEEDLWENGQRMLIDIARREGLDLGPNRHMQELMARRNEEIIEFTQTLAVGSDMQAEIDDHIGEINQRYIRELTSAARLHGDNK